jgi:hypothetical protein
MKRNHGPQVEQTATRLSQEPTIKKLRSSRGARISKARLESLVDEATVDANGKAEQLGGFYTMIEENLHVPFSTQVLGVEVTVTRIDMIEGDEIVAVCSRGKQSQSISILELPLPSLPPEGAEWIAAYRYWRKCGR